jgi:hypothetical protein
LGPEVGGDVTNFEAMKLLQTRAPRSGSRSNQSQHSQLLDTQNLRSAEFIILTGALADATSAALAEEGE